MLQQIKRTGSRCLLLVPLGLIVLLFECVPLVSMFVKAFSENGHFSLAQFGTIAHQLVYRTAIINSLWVTLLSTAVGLVIDFFLALALYGDHGRKKTLYLSLLNLTSTFSGVPLTIAFITMMGTSGAGAAGQAAGHQPAGQLQPVLDDRHLVLCRSQLRHHEPFLLPVQAQ